MAASYRVLKWLRRAGLVLGLASVVLGSLGAGGAAGSWATGWLTVIATLSGAIAAFAFAGRYQYLATSYAVTARRLRSLLIAWERLRGPQSDLRAPAFVQDCEATISIENKNWLAEWTADKPDEAGAREAHPPEEKGIARQVTRQQA